MEGREPDAGLGDSPVLYVFGPVEVVKQIEKEMLSLCIFISCVQDYNLTRAHGAISVLEGQIRGVRRLWAVEGNLSDLKDS